MATPTSSSSAAPPASLDPRADLYRGCLVGQALGDALGAVVEGQPGFLCALYVSEELRAGKAGARGRAPFGFGQYTDDTQMARELCQSFVEARGFDTGAYARRVAALFGEGRIVGRGRATEGAAHRLLDGVPWTEAGAPAPNAGNGSAMRAAPVGLFFPGLDDTSTRARIAAARDQGHITHQDRRCAAGSIAIAGAVARVLNRQPLLPSLPSLVEEVRAADADFADAILELGAWVALPPTEAAARVIARSGPVRDGWDGISPFVLPSVLWSLYAFLHTPDDYFATICTAIAVGGDVDTTAAMAGAISGASLGLSGLGDDARRLIPCLDDQGTWRLPELERLCDDVLALVAAGPNEERATEAPSRERFSPR